ncbi:MAG TPA: carotenoid biosynthesis protein [Gemmatimonadaceae bacterium]|nr:carotenoid biosynthesis protein [Gemmatimonadaceae bacterium]
MTNRAADRLSQMALWILYAFTAAALIGYATFGVHPGLMSELPGAAKFYSYAFRFFSVSTIWIAFATLALFLTRAVGIKWLPAFAALYAISLGSELSGTITGLPFGEYRYSPLLEPMWLGHVPIVIPLSWFFMSVPSYALARAVLPDSGRTRGQVVLLASAILVSWDLSLDPAMSYATQYWMWGTSGSYYGMPWLNLVGWYVTGLALMIALAALDADRWIAALPIRWLGGFYLANLALPVGMNIAAGLWGAVLAAFAALAAAWVLARRLRAADLRTAATLVSAG